MALLAFLANDSYGQEANTKSSITDRIDLKIAFGVPTLLKLDENIKVPIAVSGGIEGSYRFPVKKNLSLSTGLGFLLDRMMVNGQFQEGLNGDVKFSRVNNNYTENYYLTGRLFVPLSLRLDFPDQAGRASQFVNFGVKMNFVTSYFHKYELNGNGTATNVKGYVPTTMPSVFLSFGQTALKRSRSSIVNQLEGEISLDLRPLDNYGLRRLAFTFKVGI